MAVEAADASYPFDQKAIFAEAYLGSKEWCQVHSEELEYAAQPCARPTHEPGAEQPEPVALRPCLLAAEQHGEGDKEQRFDHQPA